MIFPSSRRPSRRPPLRRRFASLTLAALILGVARLVAQPAGKPTEYQVKAAYLYNFGRFVEWPAHADGDGFGICVIGRDPFGQTLDSAVAGQSINGRGVVTRRLPGIAEAAGCRILFISASEDAQVNRILSTLQNTSVLTVSDMPRFTERGGMVQFIQDGNRVRFEINRAVAERAGLTLSSELLRVASAVRGGA
jgi:hypothetical protein